MKTLATLPTNLPTPMSEDEINVIRGGIGVDPDEFGEKVNKCDKCSKCDKCTICF